MWMYVALISTLIATGAFAEEKTSTVGNVTTSVLGQSGKIRVYKGNDVANAVTFTFDGIFETDASGEIITAHSYNNFAQLDFNFSELENTTYPNSNVSVLKFSFEADIPVDSNTATLTSEVFMFREDGNITVDGNEVEVEEGIMKFNVKIESWSFCDTCKNKGKDVTGEFLDLSIDMKGAKKPTTSKPGVYDFGGGASVLVPEQVTYDNQTTEDMPDGYPMVTNQGSKNIFTFRFKKFSASALYDPIVDLGDSDDSGGSDTDTTTPASEESKTIEGSDVRVEILGRSGKMTMMPADTSTSDAAKRKITIECDNLVEMTSAGKAINDVGHKFQTLANQDFTFSSPSDEKYPGTDIDTKKITLETTLSNNAKLTLPMYVFKADGDIVNGDETISVKAGTMKFNVVIENWSFCTADSNCHQNAVGASVDLDIIIKGSGKANKDTSEGSNAYNVGSGVVILAKMIDIDGTMVEMAEDYPMLAQQGSKDIFKFRFPKFDKVMYDPSIRLAEENGTSGTHASFATLIVAILSLIIQRAI